MPLVSRNPATAGDGGGVQVVTVPVSSAQILDLFNTPVLLVPGVPGSVIVPIGAGTVYVAGATPYTDNGGNIIAAIGSSTMALTSGAGFWDQATSQGYMLGFGGINAPGAVSLFAGTDLLLSEDTANPTLGDGTLLVTLSYFLAPTV